MKKILMALLVLGSSPGSLHAQSINLSRLAGQWMSAEGGGLEVQDSSKIFLVYEGQKKAVSAITADFSRSPCWFDFTVDNDGKPLQIKTLLLFVNDDLIQWQMFDDGQRPAYFNAGKGEMVYLRRKK